MIVLSNQFPIRNSYLCLKLMFHGLVLFLYRLGDLQTPPDDRGSRIGKETVLRSSIVTTVSGSLREVEMQFVTTKIDVLLRLPEVLAIFPVSRSTWYQGIKDGRYPSPLKIGVRASAWRASQIEQLIAAASLAGMAQSN